MTGVGLCGSGTAKGGWGDPSTATQVVPTATGSQSKVQTGAVSSVSIDWRTKTYEDADDYGNPEDMGDTAQRVQVLMSEMYQEKPAYQDDGMELPLGISDNLNTILLERVRRALSPVLEDGSAELLSVGHEAYGTRILALVEWKDTSTNTVKTDKRML